MIANSTRQIGDIKLKIINGTMLKMHILNEKMVNGILLGHIVGQLVHGVHATSHVEVEHRHVL
jgi:hypothetical protein